MIPLYHETRALRETVERLLADVPLEPTASRREFGPLLANADVGIICLGRCSATDVQWLTKVSRGGLLAPSCIVITPLSIGRLQRLRGIESERIHVVWAEEVDDRLVDVVTEIAPWHDDPLRLLGRRLLAVSSPHRSVAEAIRRICNLSGHRPPTRPETSVTELAFSLGISPDSFRRYWREGIPLRCGPKVLLNWAVLLWAFRQRRQVKWDALARQAGIGRRTLERYGRQLADCTLAEASRDPKLLKRRFREWARAVSAVTTEAAPT
ncbi:MAG: hypothetical protein OXH08_00370 [Gammaproteobacteria bacterium]|nr:hypothetical protein [Gammaproteobacteria bacterium]MDE0651822.1 hypothetical protein [Gammaproteobacteria bacterium]